VTMAAIEPSDAEIQSEAARLSAFYKSRPARLARGFERLIVRTVRIAIGALVACVAYWIATGASDITHQPISALSLADLGSVLLRLIGALAVVLVACLIAFGPYKEPYKNFTMQAASALRTRYKEQERLAGKYAKSNLWGMLSDPELARKRPMAAILLWLGVIAVIAIAAGLVTLYVRNAT
jgi:hypothetical protein